MPTGSDAYVRYKREAGAYTGHDITGDANWKVFGHGLNIAPSLKRTKRKIYGIGGRQPTALTTHELELNADLSFQLSNPWWMRNLIGNTPTTTGVGPYSHYFLDTANENGGGAVTLPNAVPAFTIENGLNLTADSVRLYKGAVISSMSLSASIGSDVDVKLACPFRTIAKGTAGIASQTVDTENPMTFVMGTLSKGGVALASVQNVTLDINNSFKPIMGIGSEALTNHTEHELDIGLRASMYFLQDTDIIDVLLGGTTVPTTPTVVTMELVFDNGLATTAQRQVQFKFTGVEIQDSVLTQAIENPLIEDFTPIIKALTLVKAINNTATAI